MACKINSKWFKDLNVWSKTTKLTKEKRRKVLDIGLGDDFLDLTPKEMAIKAKLNKWNYIKLKSLCRAKETICKRLI